MSLPARNYPLVKKNVLRGTYGKIWRIQIKMCPQTSFEPEYGAFNLKNKVSAHGLAHGLADLKSSSPFK